MTCLQAHIQKVNPKWFWFWRLTEIHSGHTVLTISPLCLFLFFFFSFLFLLFFLSFLSSLDTPDGLSRKLARNKL